MCLITEQKEPKTALEDMIVYKMVNRADYSSPYHDFIWEKNVLYKQEMTFVPKPSHDNMGFASNIFYADEISNDAYCRKTDCIAVQKGFHAYKSIKRATQEGWGRIRKDSLIPKGSLDFEDETGLIVANQMMML